MRGCWEVSLGSWDLRGGGDVPQGSEVSEDFGSFVRSLALRSGFKAARRRRIPSPTEEVGEGIRLLGAVGEGMRLPQTASKQLLSSTSVNRRPSRPPPEPQGMSRTATDPSRRQARRSVASGSKVPLGLRATNHPFEGGCHGLYLMGMMRLYTADQEAGHAPRKSL